MRPSVDKLRSKLRDLPTLQDPLNAEYVLGDLMYWFFVHKEKRPSVLLRLLYKVDALWHISLLGEGLQEDEAKVKFASKSVTTEDAPKKLSLPTPEELRETFGMRVRNDTTPGPSHKSPIAYKDQVGVGFTVPGIEGKFVWHATELKQKPPDMDHVVEVVAAGLAGLPGRSPDLDDKKLKKKVRVIIWSHTYDTNFDQPTCSCGAEFDLGEEWAIHVRKLIWKELKSSAKA